MDGFTNSTASTAAISSESSIRDLLSEEEYKQKCEFALQSKIINYLQPYKKKNHKSSLIYALRHTLGYHRFPAADHAVSCLDTDFFKESIKRLCENTGNFKHSALRSLLLKKIQSDPIDGQAVTKYLNIKCPKNNTINAKDYSIKRRQHESVPEYLSVNSIEKFIIQPKEAYNPLADAEREGHKLYRQAMTKDYTPD